MLCSHKLNPPGGIDPCVTGFPVPPEVTSETFKTLSGDSPGPEIPTMSMQAYVRKSQEGKLSARED